jgi:hypothetical protein
VLLQLLLLDQQRVVVRGASCEKVLRSRAWFTDVIGGGLVVEEVSERLVALGWRTLGPSRLRLRELAVDAIGAVQVRGCSDEKNR